MPTSDKSHVDISSRTSVLYKHQEVIRSVPTGQVNTHMTVIATTTEGKINTHCMCQSVRLSSLVIAIREEQVKSVQIHPHNYLSYT